MKPISTKIQEKIMFIPYLNYANIPILLYNSIFFLKSVHTSLKSLWIFFSTCLPLIIAQQCFFVILPTVGVVIFYVNAYIIPVILGYRFIRLQKNLDHT